MLEVIMKPSTDSSHKCRAAILIVLYSAFALVVGCDKNPQNTWSAEEKSSDGNWVAMARSEQWSGPGNNYDATTVSLKQTNGVQPPIEILNFVHDYAHMDLKMTWISPTHLDVEYGSHAKVNFQAIKAFGSIVITTRDVSDEATSPPR
jgi:hypothetical protein